MAARSTDTRPPARPAKLAEAGPVGAVLPRESVPTPSAPAPAARDSTAAPATPVDRLEPANAEELWKFVRAFVADKPGKQAMISRLRALEFDGSRAVIGCAPAALTAISGQSRALGDLIQAVLGRPVHVTITEADQMVSTLPDSPTSPSPPLPASSAGAPGEGQLAGGAAASVGVSAGASRGPARGPVEVPPEVRDHPLVRKAEAMFGARVVGVRESGGE